MQTASKLTGQVLHIIREILLPLSKLFRLQTRQQRNYIKNPIKPALRGITHGHVNLQTLSWFA
jgi:hypothetical protein